MFEKRNHSHVSTTIDVDELIRRIKNGDETLGTAFDFFAKEKLSEKDLSKVMMECEDILRKDAWCQPVEPIQRSLDWAVAQLKLKEEKEAKEKIASILQFVAGK